MASTRLLIAAIATVQLGCVLLVESSPTGDQFSTACAVADPTSACGACMTQKCGAELSSCCGDATCRSALTEIDQCAEAGTCIVDTTSSFAAALVKCVDQQCTACNAEPATPTNGAKIACFVSSAGDSCNCSAGSQNATRCDLTTVPNAVCCADLDYPTSSYSSCTCATVTCMTYGSDCDCSAGSVGNTSTCDTNIGGACCVSSAGGFCSCGSALTSCPSNELAVTDCATPASVGCSTTKKRVNNCSPTAN